MATLRDSLEARLGPDADRRVDGVLSAPFLAVQLAVVAIPWLGWDLARIPVRAPLARRRALGPGAAIAAAALLFPVGAAGTIERFEGTARDSDGRVAYVEEHEVQREGGRLVAAETLYRDADGRLIARLSSDYARDPFAPDYRFEDLRSGAIEAVRWTEAGLELQGSGKLRVLVPGGSLPLVTGQGLDRFARARLDELSRGDELRVEMALPSRLDSYRFRVRADAPGDAAAVRVHFEPASFFLRLLAPSIEADYERSTGRLLRYRGVSNLAGPDGETMVVDIRYRVLPS